MAKITNILKVSMEGVAMVAIQKKNPFTGCGLPLGGI
jgi:hypothetical protein